MNVVRLYHCAACGQATMLLVPEPVPCEVSTSPRVDPHNRCNCSEFVLAAPESDDDSA